MLGFILGFLCGIAVFYLVPKIRVVIRDSFLPWLKSLK